jgi:hypothetical protein
MLCPKNLGIHFLSQKSSGSEHNKNGCSDSQNRVSCPLIAAIREELTESKVRLNHEAEFMGDLQGSQNTICQHFNIHDLTLLLD